MSLEKTKLRSAAMHEVGARLDDVLGSAQQEVYRIEGEERALKKSAERMIQLMAAVNSEAKEDKLGIDEAKLVKSYLMKGAEGFKDSVASAQKRRFAAQGMVMGLERSVKETKGMFDREVAKSPEEPVEESSGDEMGVVSNPVAQRARGGSLKEQRLAEDQVEKEAESKKVSGAAAMGAIGNGKFNPKPKARKRSRAVKKTSIKKPEAKA